MTRSASSSSSPRSISISGGRAEIIAGRGSYIESFPLFGYDLNDYSELFAEKLDLLLKLRAENPVTWQVLPAGRCTRRSVSPQPGEIPLWVAVGGTPVFVVRAAHLGLPMALAIIGGSYRQFAPFADLYRKAATQFGHDAGTLKLSINSPGFLAATHREAIEVSHPYFESGWMANHHQRGQGVPMPLAAYEAQSTRPASSGQPPGGNRQDPRPVGACPPRPGDHSDGLRQRPAARDAQINRAARRRGRARGT